MMRRIITFVLLLVLLCVPVLASVFPEAWSDADRENFRTLYGDRDIEEFFEIADKEGYTTSEVVSFLNQKQALIAAGLAVDGGGYLVDAKELEKALEEEKKRQEELLEEKEKELVITVPEKPADEEAAPPLNKSVMTAVCAILLGGVFTVMITGKKKNNHTKEK